MAEPGDAADRGPRPGPTDGAPGNGEHAPAAAPRSELDPVAAMRREVADLNARIAGLEKLLQDRSTKLDDVSRRFNRLERRIDRASASFPVRTALGLRRRLHRLLK